ncbi:hypothetical protein PR048_014052 [Dryococelus australis]|uniref:Uncharacterized protein n=1 Tax=Dryococelus australis TaxID=614101 RepID=A0ABQ9HTX7_9NEOP|nr:hypothetical protein PR048_014052 [Dryococelus australis]
MEQHRNKGEAGKLEIPEETRRPTVKRQNDHRVKYEYALSCRWQPMAVDKLLLGVCSLELYRALIFLREKSLTLSVGDKRVALKRKSAPQHPPGLRSHAQSSLTICSRHPLFLPRKKKNVRAHKFGFGIAGFQKRHTPSKWLHSPASRRNAVRQPAPGKLLSNRHFRPIGIRSRIVANRAQRAFADPRAANQRTAVGFFILASNRCESGSIPGRFIPGFRKRESCRTMSLVGRFSRGSPVSSALSFRRCYTLTSLYPHRLSRPRCDMKINVLKWRSCKSIRRYWGRQNFRPDIWWSCSTVASTLKHRVSDIYCCREKLCPTCACIHLSEEATSIVLCSVLTMWHWLTSVRLTTTTVGCWLESWRDTGARAAGLTSRHLFMPYPSLPLRLTRTPDDAGQLRVLHELAVVYWLGYFPPAQANRVRFPVGSPPRLLYVGIVPDYAAGRRALPLAPPLPRSPSSALKISLLRSDQISSRAHL